MRGVQANPIVSCESASDGRSVANPITRHAPSTRRKRSPVPMSADWQGASERAP